MAGDTRDRMIEATVDALRRRGVAGMSFTEVLRESGAARGAIYHHFPGGKGQLVAEAAARNGQDVRATLAALPAADPVGFVASFLALIRPVVECSATGSGCAVAAVTIASGEPAENASLREVAATAFTAWADTLTERLTVSGLTPDDAAGLATTLLALLEGAQVLCRAAGSAEPFDRMADTALDLARSRYS
ncbi:TetR/AcrR family transcriptional regulator [Streptacidiphilus jiangxiensis]|uniref:DNA-binding transcriptional regulator, AcrR family n=1 Tax=Streptacidiphilus jiangxiensis TaxID=235985 RepID=A0A1H7XCG8_STRJI|nr:TetR/AcrR family transcriptional regulator [Streptacidiphilus jiangxiensis]SEM31500.1 DNA-binding transcriptional regulator, AcrR family [Streptacidiphilus jiangxiensis]